MAVDKEKSPWGDVIYVDDESETEEKDEVQRLIQEVAALRKQKLPDNVPLKAAVRKKNEQIAALEKQIYDLIKLRKHKKMFG